MKSFNLQNIDSEALDRASRETIVSYNKEDLSKSYLVEAGAGSGKTECLSDRIIALVENGVDINQICAITFTKIAATEFKKRLIRKLKLRSEGSFSDNKDRIGQLPIPDSSNIEEIQKRCLQAYNELQRNDKNNIIGSCFMGTMDSFCFQFMQKYGGINKIKPKNPADIAKNIFDKINMLYSNGADFDNVLGNFDSATSFDETIISNFFRLNENARNVYINGMQILLDNSEYELYLPEEYSNPNVIKNRLDEIESEFEAELPVIRDILEGIAENAVSKDNRSDFLKGDDIAQEIKDYIHETDGTDISDTVAYFYKDSLRKNIDEIAKLFKRNSSNQADDSGNSKLLIELLEEKGTIIYLLCTLKLLDDFTYYKPLYEYIYSFDNQEKYHNLYQELLKLQYASTIALIRHTYADIEKKIDADIASNNILTHEGDVYMSFHECRDRVRNILRKSAASDGFYIKKMAEHYNYYFIDEFQDTNLMQAEIFFYLTMTIPEEGWIKVDSWKKCVPRPSSLFIVGDPKQSIYGFNGADVNSYKIVDELFKIYEQKGIGKKLYLTCNFRSGNKLINYFNNQKLFKEIFRDSSCDYIDIPVAAQKEGQFQGIYKYVSACGSLKDKERNDTDNIPIETEENMLAKLVISLVDNDDYRIIEDGILRTINFSDIMIIGRSRAQAKRSENALNIRGIPTRNLSTMNDNDSDKMLRSENAVILSTIHKAKGTESPIVILCYSWPFTHSPKYWLDRDNAMLYILGIYTGTDDYPQTGVLRASNSYGINYNKSTPYIYSEDLYNYYSSGNASDKLYQAFLEQAQEDQRLVYVAATRAENALFVCDSRTKLLGFENKNRWQALLDVLSDKWIPTDDIDMNRYITTTEEAVCDTINEIQHSKRLYSDSLF